MSAALNIDTAKVSDRRDLVFHSMAEVEADMNRILDAEQQGRLRQLGNWTPGQVFWHVGEIIRGSFDGVPFQAPWFIRMLGGVLRKSLIGSSKPFKAGIALKGSSAVIIPSPDISSDEGATYLRTQLERLKKGEKMTRRSPFLGAMSHEDWLILHRKHAALHFSFLKPE